MYKQNTKLNILCYYNQIKNMSEEKDRRHTNLLTVVSEERWGYRLLIFVVALSSIFNMLINVLLLLYF